ncbi:heavy-metal-associated domain-containing protein [Candidatus Micrarchaeota archaeon]|nr:heavy-metal-associated domain-containing protein [Candidatus Micrarchaeota archaeon]
MEKIIKVSGMHCKSCEMLLSDSISEIPGVQKVSADSKTGQVQLICNDESVVGLAKKAIEKEGYKVIS